MVGIEIITSLLATSTAKAIAKFLDDKVGEYISKKFDDKPPSELGTLKREIEELKTSLQDKKSTEVSQVDIQEISNAIAKIEQRQSSSSDKIITDSIFLDWSNNKLDIESQALIARKELEMLLDSASKLKISENKRWDIRQIMSAIDLNLDDFTRARRQEEIGLGEHGDVRKYEINLRHSIFAAKDLFEGFYNVK